MALTWQRGILVAPMGMTLSGESMTQFEVLLLALRLTQHKYHAELRLTYVNAIIKA